MKIAKRVLENEKWDEKYLEETMVSKPISIFMALLHQNSGISNSFHG